MSNRSIGWLAAITAFVLVRFVWPEYQAQQTYEDISQSIDDGTIVDQIGIDDMNPYDLVKSMSTGNNAFQRSVVDGAALAMRRNTPGAEVHFAERAEVDDLMRAMRITVRYSGHMPIEDLGKQPVRGFGRMYYHSTGMLSLEAICLESVSSCSELPDLLAHSERSILANAAGSGVAGVLPPGGDCWIDTVSGLSTYDQADISPDMAACWYEPGSLLALTRMNVPETRQMLRSAMRDPEVKQNMRRYLDEAAGR